MTLGFHEAHSEYQMRRIKDQTSIHHDSQSSEIFVVPASPRLTTTPIIGGCPLSSGRQLRQISIEAAPAPRIFSLHLLSFNLARQLLLFAFLLPMQTCGSFLVLLTLRAIILRPRCLSTVERSRQSSMTYFRLVLPAHTFPERLLLAQMVTGYSVP